MCAGQCKTGDTYFLRADEEPTTRLEGIARSVFEFHTVRLFSGDVGYGGAWLHDGQVDRSITNTHHHAHTHTHAHTYPQQHAAFDPSRSGAEWWVQVLDEDDDIGASQ